MTTTHYLIIAAYGLGWLAITVGPWLIGIWLVCALIEAIATPKVIVMQPEQERTEREPTPIRAISWKEHHDRLGNMR